MVSNTAIHYDRPTKVLIFLSMAGEIMSLLVERFEDKEAAEERRKQHDLWFKQVRDRNGLIFTHYFSRYSKLFNVVNQNICNHNKNKYNNA